MKTQEKNVSVNRGDEPYERKHAGTALPMMKSIGAMLVVALLITMSLLIFTFLHNEKTTGALPRNQWKGVLSGYNISSLVAARGNPATLYACATIANSVQGATGSSYTVWYSHDYGDSWFNSGPKSEVQGTCQLAVNTVNGDDVYVIGGAAGAQAGGASILKHSSDGGHTWNSIQPTLQGVSATWNIQDISVVGNVLFGIQWFNEQAGPLPNGRVDQVMPAIVYSLAHVIESADGGQHWMAIDATITTVPQSVHNYVVDPGNPHIIYEILGTPWASILHGNSISGYGLNETLYKTTDNGQTWSVLLKNLRIGSSIQIASTKTTILYIGGSLLRMPQLPQNNGQGVYPPDQITPSSTTNPPAYSNFLLQMSSDGGATWQIVPQPAQPISVQNWFVGADGQFYSSAGYIPVVGTGNANVGQTVQIMQYNPSDGAWKAAAKTPLPGSLIAVTPDGAGSTLLWLLTTDNGKLALYRYAE